MTCVDQMKNQLARSVSGSSRFMRILCPVVLVAFAWGHAAPSNAAQSAPAAQTALADLNAPGPEGEMLAAQVGLWTVTETMWVKPGAEPVVSGGLVAERRLAGNLLEETLRSESGAAILRRDFLTFNRVEGRWAYMSFDTRVAAGMMTAQSFGPEKGGKIDLVFQPFALPGGSAVPGDLTAPGQLLRMRQEIIRVGRDHIVKNQYLHAGGRSRRRVARPLLRCCTPAVTSTRGGKDLIPYATVIFQAATTLVAVPTR